MLTTLVQTIRQTGGHPPEGILPRAECWTLMFGFNSLTELLFKDALQQAKEMDERFARLGKPVGPLHGVPMTLKDQFNVKGYDTTIGYVGRAFSPATDDAIIVKMLRSLGAVVLSKTNLPQSIMVYGFSPGTSVWNLTDGFGSGARRTIRSGA
jgi:Asp-tRNA(Asn)/Glu-tRNA(Gln) amidotransferase A subunit family amidase